MWSSGIKFSRNGFKCAYCNKRRVGAYRWVYGAKSCSRCNRAEDPKPQVIEVIKPITCPLCKGRGKIVETEL